MSCQDWDVLSNRSLLLFSASREDGGNYSCTGWITGHPLNSSTFDITITEGEILSINTLRFLTVCLCVCLCVTDVGVGLDYSDAQHSY